MHKLLQFEKLVETVGHRKDVGSLCGGPCHAQCQLPVSNKTLLSLAKCSGAQVWFGHPISVIVLAWKFEKFYRGSNTNLQKAVATLIAIEKTHYPSERLETFSKDDFSCKGSCGSRMGGVASWLAVLALMTAPSRPGCVVQRFENKLNIVASSLLRSFPLLNCMCSLFTLTRYTSSKS